MRKLILALAVVVMCLGMTGCAARTQQEIASLDYGTYPENYEAIVRGHMNNLLFDPYSAQFNFQGTPSQQYKPAGLLADEAYGWGGVVYINAKGDVLLNCDLSYQKQKKYVIGNVLKESLNDILIRNLDEESLKGAEMCG